MLTAAWECAQWIKAVVLPCRRERPGEVGSWGGSGLQVCHPARGHVFDWGRPTCAADECVPPELVGRCILLQGMSTRTSGSALATRECCATWHAGQSMHVVSLVLCRSMERSTSPCACSSMTIRIQDCFPVQGHRSCASTARLNLLLRCLFAVCTGCEGILMRALLQGEEDEAAPEKPAKKPVREEDVFAGNKNLRSEDVKFREMHDDRCAGSCPENPALAWPAQHGFRAQTAWEWGRLTSAHGLQEVGDCRSQHLAAITLFHGMFIKKPLLVGPAHSHRCRDRCRSTVRVPAGRSRRRTRRTCWRRPTRRPCAR